MFGLHQNRTLRRLLLPIFARLNPGDVTIRHHYTGAPLRLHSFRHKGYWFYGRRREAQSMSVFSKLIGPGDRVIEVGGHIGYVSMYFASLVGPRGAVWVFEPGPNNLPYLRRNTSSATNITIVEAGVGETPGRATFFVEDLTGQNNSFVKDFEHLEINRRQAGLEANVSRVDVAMTTLDAFVHDQAFAPTFIKIDVEGFELEVLRGATRVLREARPALMVEVQSHHDALTALAAEAGYLIFDEAMRPRALDASWHGNTFWLHRDVADAMRRRCSTARETASAR